MNARLLPLLLSIALLAPASSAQSVAANARTVPVVSWYTAFDSEAPARTEAVLMALVKGDHTPLLAATSPVLAEQSANDFAQYLDAVTARIGTLQRFRVLGAQVTPSKATAVLAEVEGAHGTDVIQFVWRRGVLVTMNRGLAPFTVRVAAR